MFREKRKVHFYLFVMFYVTFITSMGYHQPICPIEHID